MTTFETAKSQRALIEAELASLGAILRAFRSEAEIGPMGLTPDHIKAMPEWKAAKHNYQVAFEKLRKFNAVFVKKFKKELAAERAARVKALVIWSSAK